MEIWDAQPTPDPVYTAGTMITLAQVELKQEQRKWLWLDMPRPSEFKKKPLVRKIRAVSRPRTNTLSFSETGETQRANELKSKFAQ